MRIRQRRAFACRGFCGALDRSEGIVKIRVSMILLMFTLISSLGFAGESKPRSYVQKEGFVPDQATAIRIAEAVWIPIQGEAEIADERPFNARLQGGIWVVTGPLHADLGGVAHAEISRRDAHIIRVSHGK